MGSLGIHTVYIIDRNDHKSCCTVNIARYCYSFWTIVHHTIIVVYKIIIKKKKKMSTEYIIIIIIIKNIKLTSFYKIVIKSWFI